VPAYVAVPEPCPAYWVSSLAMTDLDQETQGGGHSNYGEAVGVVLRSGMAATPSLFGFADGQFCLSGQDFRWTMATPMQRSGSEELTQ
jgi:hypothetical protein